MPRLRGRLLPVAIALSLATVPLLCLSASRWYTDRVTEARSGPRQTYPLPNGAAFLTEKEALSMAIETLRRSGYAAADWRPVPDDRTKAPDGTRDKYLLRQRDGRSSMMFISDKASPRTVHFEHEGDRITAYVYVDK